MKIELKPLNDNALSIMKKHLRTFKYPGMITRWDGNVLKIAILEVGRRMFNADADLTKQLIKKHCAQLGLSESEYEVTIQ